ncbi:hypothetical protein K458DRAFT_313964 [Lentithecium fluviatile CBS 122367]|uniref:Uncharacterized protein n=1 Tax=Lentithecium fluviatile CBS 122367 TaxID=1168545 RepID=A0A6G1IMY7_9PLEO|nr:hypothetical protein K458DRAFT_313964 [Lentithecium fluviatile CBS 122367]
MSGTTETQFHTWKAEPLTRGTFSILSSCLTTLGFSVWTAVHLNLPEHKKESEQYWRKIKWLLVALLAPEFVSASTTLQDDYEAESDPQKRYARTPTHSIYAAMGGFFIGTHGERDNFLPRNRRRITLTGDGVIWLLQHEPSLLPNISKAVIRDKSKASGLLKAFVCLQAAWFCAQCFSRWKQDLTVSLLELNTLAHSLCALLTYMLWWNKPLDVEQPTLMPGKESQGVFAFMSLASWKGKGVFSSQNRSRR